MEHYFQDIQGWTSFGELYTKVVNEAPDGSRFCEVGCWLGRSAAYMGVEIINSEKDLHLICVDHWKGSVEHTDVPEDLFLQFKKNIAPVKQCVMPMKAKSTDAAAKFDDGYFYFVFIDAGHEYEDVIADIKAWLPKVKKGGILAGDDYNMIGVQKAVMELLPDAHLGNTPNQWPYWWIRV